MRAMQRLADEFFTTEEQERIVAAVQAAEKTTAGEIVPMVVSSSSPYPRADAMGGVLLGLVAAAGVAQVAGMDDVWSFIPLFLVATIAFQVLLHFTPNLKRLFISRHEMQDAVEEAAAKAFFTQGLHRTRDETGILIFISVYERKVWVLADRGINAKVDTATWQELVDLVVAGIKAKRQAQAVCDAVARCGAILHDHFPIKADDTDELANLIVGNKAQ
ncbi:MAG: TPM domain-containing protein [Desulfovibrionaceae bacterium]